MPGNVAGALSTASERGSSEPPSASGPVATSTRAPPSASGVAATSTVVTRYSPATKTTKEIAIYPQLIVGAGVSTCAPEK